jgi:hypothetical protein
MPSVFRRLGELYAMRSLDVIGLFSEGERTSSNGRGSWWVNDSSAAE